MKGKKGKEKFSKVLASLITLGLIVLLILSGPATAISLSLSLQDPAASQIEQGNPVSFIASVNVNANERSPIQYLQVQIFNPDRQKIQECSFSPSGIPLNASQCTDISIAQLSSSAGYGYGYGYMYDGYGYGYQTGYSNGDLVYNITLLTSQFDPSYYHASIVLVMQNTPIKSSGNISFSIIPANLPPSAVVPENESYTLNDSINQIVLIPGSPLDEIIIPASVALNVSVLVNLSSMLNGQNLLLENGLHIIRYTPNTSITYELEIPLNTLITGDSGWLGDLQVPFPLSTQNFTAPSSGDVHQVISLGSNVGLNFSNAVKIVLPSMANKRAAWVRNGTVLQAIHKKCDALTNPTNIDPVNQRECYIDSGADLVIWTYHFTEFAAYTPGNSIVSQENKNQNSGGCGTSWTCTSWSSCSNGQQTRVCSPKQANCYANPNAKPAESQSCQSPQTPTDIVNRPTPNNPRVDSVSMNPSQSPQGQAKGLASRITGAVIGASQNTGAVIALIIVLTTIGTYIGLKVAKRKREDAEIAQMLKSL